MITPRKKQVDYNIPKLVPTIKIFCPMSLKAYIQMRKVCLDYGKQYFLRTQAIYLIQLILFVIGFMILVLDYAGVITILKNYKAILIVDFSVYVIYLTITLYYGAAINK